jgi:hypothetical protein
MSEKWNFLQPESTLAELGIELIVSKSLQNNSEMLCLLFITLGIDQDVIKLWHEYRVHQEHKMCRSIGESKRHNQILIQPISGREDNLREIFQTDLDLMITRTKIDLGKDSCTAKLIKENVDAGQWIHVLDGDDIQRPIVNT